MRLVKADDFNDVINAFVTGVASIDHIAPGVVRVSYYIECEDPGYEDERQRRIVSHQIWSISQLMDNLLIIQQVLAELRFGATKPQIVQKAGMQ